MADVYSAVILDDDYWDGTESWAGETSEANRDTKYSTRRYTSLAAWETARDGAAQAGDDEHAIISGPWASADANGFDVISWDVDNVHINCPLTLPDGENPARHNGILDDKTNAYVLDEPTDNGISLYENGSIDGLQIKITDTEAGVYTAAGLDGTTVKNCVIQLTTEGGGYCTDLRGDNETLENCIGVGAGGGTNGRAFLLRLTNSAYNCLACGTQFARAMYSYTANECTWVNCASFNNADNWFGTPASIAYSASDNNQPGTGNVDWDSGATDWAENFNDYANDDFTIGSEGGDADIVGAGIGPSSDANVPTTDIIGNSRSGATCTIGPFEYVSEEEGWSNIASVNGVDEADISSINGVLKANIASINGVAV